MATAIYDLPDPLDDRRSTAPPSPDDLLSQMADDAIDKLIAESDAQNGPPAPPLPAAAFQPPPAPAVPTPPATEPGETITLSPEETPIEAQPVTTTEPLDVADELSRPTLMSVLTAIDASPAPLPPAKAAAEGVSPVEIESPAAHADPHPPNTAAPPATAHGTAPGKVSSDVSGDVPTTSADIKALLADDASAGHDRPSILMLPLEVLSAPLTHADDRIRNAVGQVAIVTLLNAIAVLVYVLVVRHK